MDIVVLGCGSQARYVIDNLVSSSHEQPIALVDIEGGAMVGTNINGVPVRWSLDEAEKTLAPSDCELIIAHGDNDRKISLRTRFAEHGFNFASAVHSTAVISPSARIGNGVIINAGAVILPNAEIGDHAVVHSGCVVEHDCIVGNAANLAPGVILAGRVEVGDAAYLYTGCRVAPGVTIGDHTVVGAGAVVLSSIPDRAVAMGVPARIQKNETVQT